MVRTDRYERAAREYAEMLGDADMKPTTDCLMKEQFEQWLYEEEKEEQLHFAEMAIGEW